MSLEDKADEYYQEPICLFNMELRYRTIDIDKQTGKQTNYCLLRAKECVYFKQEGHKELCMNYDTRYK